MKTPSYRSRAAIAAAAKGDYLNAGLAETPGAIERQEAEGQRQLAGTPDRLPIINKNFLDRSTESILTGLGFTVGQSLDGLFLPVAAPQGWQVIPQEGTAFWTDLVDDQGRLRATIYYSPAFYEREANITFETRFDVEPRWFDASWNSQKSWPNASYTSRVVADRLTGETPFGTETLTVVEITPDIDAHFAYKSACGALEDRCRSWLDENRPDWRQPDAYWTEADPVPR